MNNRSTDVAEMIGHNNPPPVAERLAEDYSALIDAVDALALRANKAPKGIEDDDAMAPVSSLVKEISATSKRVEKLRVDEKEPYLKAGREVDGFFKTLTDRLDRMHRNLNARITDYLREKAMAERRAREEEERRRREEERRAAEEAERAMREAQAAEAAARMVDAERALAEAVQADQRAKDARVDAMLAEQAAAAKPADLARTRTADTLSTLRREWVFEIEDLSAVPLEALRPYIARDAIEKAVRGFVRVGGRQLAGVRIYENETAVVR